MPVTLPLAGHWCDVRGGIARADGMENPRITIASVLLDFARWLSRSLRRAAPCARRSLRSPVPALAGPYARRSLRSPVPTLAGLYSCGAAVPRGSDVT